jgi:hypothetical protein
MSIIQCGTVNEIIHLRPILLLHIYSDNARRGGYSDDRDEFIQTILLCIYDEFQGLRTELGFLWRT